MNKHILFVMRNLDNPELFTQEEKEVNKKSAAAAYADTAAYADAAADAAANTANTADAAANVYVYAADVYASTEWWVNEFFERSGEDKQTYIDEVNRLKEVKPMNKHILFVMRNLDNPELFTQEEKEGNKKSAATDWASADAAWAADAATDWTATDWASANASWAADAAANVYVYAADAAADAAYAADVEHWVNKFFERSGEDKQTYIDEVERLKEDKTMKDDKYNKTVTKGHGYKMILDVYDVLDAFEVTCPALQHLAKKALNAGKRGHKDTLTDLDDIIASALRAKELEIQRQFKKEGYE